MTNKEFLAGLSNKTLDKVFWELDKDSQESKSLTTLVSILNVSWDIYEILAERGKLGA